MVCVVARERADAVRAQELALVQHLLEHPAQPTLVEHRQAGGGCRSRAARDRRCCWSARAARGGNAPTAAEVGQRGPVPRRRGRRLRTAEAGRPSNGPSVAASLRRAVAARRRRTRPRSSHIASPPPILGHRRRDPHEVLEELLRHVDVERGARRSSMAICSMLRLYSAIHAVPSACSRCPPVGSGALRSKTPMLSSPRKPPSNTLRPSRSFRFTHQVKFVRQSLERGFEPIDVAGTARASFRAGRCRRSPRRGRAD